jgi:hypothetical protein
MPSTNMTAAVLPLRIASLSEVFGKKISTAILSKRIRPIMPITELKAKVVRLLTHYVKSPVIFARKVIL